MYRSCPICGSNKSENLRKVRMYQLESQVSLPSAYEVVCCSNCGFTYADVDTSQNDYDEYYKNCNIYADNAELKITEENRDEEFANAYALFADKVQPDANIIDIGCGNGDFLIYLKQKGFRNLCGMDPSKQAIKKLIQKGIKGNCRGVFEPIGEEDKGAFDVVISIGVIEHMYDINKYLLQVKQFLNKEHKTYFLCVCPSVEGFEKDMFAEPNYFNQEHINYFSKISLDNLLNQYGLFRVHENIYFDIGSENSREQVIMALYETKDENCRVIYDDISKRSMKNYFSKITVQENEVECKINNLLSLSKNLVVWGCGAYAMQIIEKYPAFAEKINFFVDSNTAKQGIYIGSKAVYSPECIDNSEETVIIICSMMNRDEIEEQVKSTWSKCCICKL